MSLHFVPVEIYVSAFTAAGHKGHCIFTVVDYCIAASMEVEHCCLLH